MVRHPVGDRPGPDLKYDDDVMRCVGDVVTAASATAVATRAAGLALPLGAAETAVEVTAAALAADDALDAAVALLDALVRSSTPGGLTIVNDSHSLSEEVDKVTLELEATQETSKAKDKGSTREVAGS